MTNIFLLNDNKNIYIVSSIILYIFVISILLFIKEIEILNIIVSISFSIVTGGLFSYFLIIFLNSKGQLYKILDVKEFTMNSTYINMFNFYKHRYKYKIQIKEKKIWTNSDYLKKQEIGEDIFIYNNNINKNISDNVLVPMIGTFLLFISFSILPFLSSH
jgi:hypothetical protein